MINNFTVRALPHKNQLNIVLDGFFMRSEIELAFHLIKKECSMLKKGFSVYTNIQNFKTSPQEFGFNILRMKKLLKVLGCGKIKFIGVSLGVTEMTNPNVGIYAYENGWFFS